VLIHNNLPSIFVIAGATGLAIFDPRDRLKFFPAPGWASIPNGTNGILIDVRLCGATLRNLLRLTQDSALSAVTFVLA
jgi:hypothetical protein